MQPPIAQLAEAADLKSAQSGFESLWGDVSITVGGMLVPILSSDERFTCVSNARHASWCLFAFLMIKVLNRCVMPSSTQFSICRPI